MLTNIENRLENLFEQIEMMPQDKVEAAEKVKSYLAKYAMILFNKNKKNMYHFILLDHTQFQGIHFFFASNYVTGYIICYFKMIGNIANKTFFFTLTSIVLSRL